MYALRYKGHFTDKWETLPLPEYYFLQGSTQQVTVMSFVVSENYSSLESYHMPSDVFVHRALGVPSGGQLDLHIEALIGNFNQTIDFGRSWVFTGQESGWSSTQTLTLNDGVVTVSSDSTPQPTATPTATLTPAPAVSTEPTENPTATATATAIQPETQTGAQLGLGFEQTVTLLLVVVVAGLLAVIGLLVRRRAPSNAVNR